MSGPVFRTDEGLEVISVWRGGPGAPTIGWRLVFNGGLFEIQSRTVLTDWHPVAADVALVELIRRECELAGWHAPPPEPPVAVAEEKETEEDFR